MLFRGVNLVCTVPSGQTPDTDTRDQDSITCEREELAQEMFDRTVGESSAANLSRSIPIRCSTGVASRGTTFVCAQGPARHACCMWRQVGRDPRRLS